MVFDEALNRCICPATMYWQVHHDEETGEQLMGKCVNIPPCGFNRVFKLLDWHPYCVEVRVVDNCENGEEYFSETD